MENLSKSVPQIVSKISASTIVTEYLKNLDTRVLAGELSESSRGTYVRGLNKLQNWMGASSSTDPFTDQTVRRWIADMREREYSANTIAVHLSGVKSFFLWAELKGYISLNPTMGVKGPRRAGANSSHKRDILSNTEMRSLLSAADTTSRIGIRDNAILHLMAYTAVRTIEAHRANAEDIRAERGRMVLYIQGKGQYEANKKVVVAHPNAQEAIHRWLSIKNLPLWKDKTPLFISFSKRSSGKRLTTTTIRYLVKKYFKQVGVVGDRKTTHSLRHTAITNAIQNGADPLHVRDMTGHANIDTTMIYFHNENRLKNPAEGLIEY